MQMRKWHHMQRQEQEHAAQQQQQALDQAGHHGQLLPQRQQPPLMHACHKPKRNSIAMPGPCAPAPLRDPLEALSAGNRGNLQPGGKRATKGGRGRAYEHALHAGEGRRPQHDELLHQQQLEGHTQQERSIWSHTQAAARACVAAPRKGAAAAREASTPVAASVPNVPLEGVKRLFARVPNVSLADTRASSAACGVGTGGLSTRMPSAVGLRMSAAPGPGIQGPMPGRANASALSTAAIAPGAAIQICMPTCVRGRGVLHPQRTDTAVQVGTGGVHAAAMGHGKGISQLQPRLPVAERELVSSNRVAKLSVAADSHSGETETLMDALRSRTREFSQLREWRQARQHAACLIQAHVRGHLARARLREVSSSVHPGRGDLNAESYQDESARVLQQGMTLIVTQRYARA